MQVAGEGGRHRPISTSASFFFRVRTIQVRPISTFGQFRLRPISITANFDFGQFCLASLTIPNVKMKKRKMGKEKKPQGRNNQYSPCLCEGVASRPTTLSHKHGYARFSGLNRPSCGASPAKGRRCST